jgi:hypothetical protein
MKLFVFLSVVLITATPVVAGQSGKCRPADWQRSADGSFKLGPRDISVPASIARNDPGGPSGIGALCPQPDGTFVLFLVNPALPNR